MIYPTKKQNFSLDVYNSNNAELLNGVNTNTQNIQTNAGNINALAIIKADIAKMFYPNNQYGGIVADNLDTIAVSGFYTCYGTATGSPFSNSSAFIIHQNSNVDTVTAKQIATAYTDGRMLFRYKRASVWTAWVDGLTLVGTVSTPTNVSSVTQHFANKKNGIVQYVLRATCTMTSGTSYTLETLPVGYRPAVAFYKNIEMRDTSTVLGSLSITTAGVVSIIPRTTISAQLISINEMFFT